MNGRHGVEEYKAAMDTKVQALKQANTWTKMLHKDVLKGSMKCLHQAKIISRWHAMQIQSKVVHCHSWLIVVSVFSTWCSWV